MNYAGAFHAFITNTTEAQTQALWLNAVVNAMVGHDLLTTEKPITILDIGCGPGANSLCLRSALDNHQIAHRILGCDQNPEHLEEAKAEIHRTDDLIIEGNMFGPSFDFCQTFAVDAIDLVVLAHSGYYAPDLNALVDLVVRVDGGLSETGALLSLHKAEEPTNAVKRKFDAIVESDTTQRLHEIFVDHNMSCFGNNLEAKLRFPASEQNEDDLVRAVLAAQILSFLKHGSILDLTNADIKIYVDMINELRDPQSREIKTFIQADMISASKASTGHRRHLDAINQTVGHALLLKLPLAFGSTPASL